MYYSQNPAHQQAEEGTKIVSYMGFDIGMLEVVNMSVYEVECCESALAAKFLEDLKNLDCEELEELACSPDITNKEIFLQISGLSSRYKLQSNEC